MSAIQDSKKFQEFKEIEQSLLKKLRELVIARTQAYGGEIADCLVETAQGIKNLSKLFTKNRMLVIHNMGINCKFCTAYADGMNVVSKEFLDCDVVLFSTTQLSELLDFQKKRGWSFLCCKMIDDTFSQSVGLFQKDAGVMPGIVSLYLTSKKKLIVESVNGFKPGDYFSPIWPIRALFDNNWEKYTPSNS